MNEKTLKSGEDYRRENRLRVQHFKQKMNEQGYKNVTVFMGESLRAELERLKHEKGLNRQEAVEYIFEVYNQNITGNITSNDDKKPSNVLGTEETKEKELVSIPLWGTPEYKSYLLATIKNLQEKNLNNTQIVQKLDDDGIRPLKAKKWNRDMVRKIKQ